MGDHRRTFALTLGVALAGCAAPPAPPSLPGCVVTAVHDAGSAVSEADVSTAVVASDPHASLRVTCQVLRLGRIADDRLEPLAARARLLVGHPEPIALVPRLLRGARVGTLHDGDALRALGRALAAPPPASDDADEDEVVEPVAPALATLEGALPPGVTLELAFAAAGGRAVVRVHRLATGDALDASVEVELQGERGEGPAFERGERALLSGPVPGERLALAVLLPAPRGPGPPGDGARAGLAFLIEVAPPPTSGPGREAHLAAVARCALDLEVARAKVDATAPSVAPWPAAASADTSRALDALADAGHQRLALLGLASGAGAQLAADVAAGGDDALVAAVASRALTTRGAGDLALGLERAAVLELARAVEVDDACSAAVHAMLLRATGGLALRPAVLAAAAARAVDLEALREALRVENRLLLEDGDVVARVRAAEWLAPRGALPAGYDPLASARERRLALAAHEEAGP